MRTVALSLSVAFVACWRDLVAGVVGQGLELVDGLTGHLAGLLLGGAGHVGRG